MLQPLFLQSPSHRKCQPLVLGTWKSVVHLSHQLPFLPRGQMAGAHAPYLLCSDHGDHVRSLLPHHLPEVVARVWQGPLSGDVVPFCPTDHHLEAKGSIGE